MTRADLLSWVQRAILQGADDAEMLQLADALDELDMPHDAVYLRSHVRSGQHSAQPITCGALHVLAVDLA